jgi:glycerophosphoryl diester phosphodiesterase
MLKLTFLIAVAAALLAAQTNKHVVVISHRGEHLHHPENTMAAFEAAYHAGADFFEVDIRTTSDGKLVLMHDGSAERTARVKEDISKMTFEQVRALDAGSKFSPEFKGTQVPTFDEALAFAEGKMGIYMDCKHASAKDLVDAVHAHHMQDHVVVYCGRQLCKGIQELEPAMKLMPESRNAMSAKSLIEDLGLKVMAFDANDFKEDVIAIAKAAQVEIYVDRLGPADNEATWQDAIDRGADGIQTDKPAELAAYLRSKGYKKP